MMQRLAPGLAGLVDETHLPQARGQEHPRSVGFGIAQDASPEQARSLGILLQLVGRLGAEIEDDAVEMRIERHRAVEEC